MILKDEHDEIRHRLADYVTGDMTGAERSRIAEHLSTCRECSEALERQRTFIASLKEYGDHERAQHVPEETMLRLADDPQALDQSVRSAAENHLLVCDTCSQELETLRNLENALRGRAPESQLGVRPETLSALRFLWRPAVAYAVAAAAVIILFVPLLQHYRGDRYEQESWSVAPGTETVFLLNEQTRSLKTETIVTRETREDVLRLTMAFWPDTSWTYCVLIRDDGGRQIFAATPPPAAVREGIVLITLPSRGLQDGRYIGELRAVNRGVPGDTIVTHYPFRLRSSEEQDEK